MKLFELREQKSAKIQEMRALLDAAGNQPLDAEKQKTFDGLKREVEALEQQEARQAFLDEAERRMQGTPINAEGRDHASLEQRVSVLRILQAQMEGRQLDGAEREYSQEAERRTGRRAEGVYVPMATLERRVNTTTTADGIVPPDHRPDQYISPLRNALLARRLGVRVLSNLRGNVVIPKHDSGLSVGWVGENGNVPAAGDMGFDTVTLTPKHAGGVCEMSRQTIMQSSPDIEELIREELAYLIAKGIDSALIGGGGSNEPVGVLANLAASGGVQTGSLATLSWANVLELIEKAEVANAPVSSWLTHPSAATKLRSTLKATGIAGYLMEGGRMADLAVHVTNQVPEKPGSPNTGRLILGDWSQCMLGIWSEIDLLLNPFDSTAYARGGVLVRAMSTVDIGIRHPESFIVADDVAI